MLLENRFYKVLKKSTDGMSGSFTVAILPDCNVYNGHFPNDPVCPGVCNIETIKECTMMLLCKELRITHIKQCRLTAIATPEICPEVIITITATQISENAYTVLASIKDAKQTYMEYKGTMEVQENQYENNAE
jgi:3-hydroxyacyl-[acyl-carrier-protein] dehydratase